MLLLFEEFLGIVAPSHERDSIVHHLQERINRLAAANHFFKEQVVIFRFFLLVLGLQRQ